MATVNKKFSVKNGLAVDGNVAVSNIASFVVDGPSSSSLTFTLSNVTSATINGSNIAIESWVTGLGYITTESDPVFTASDAYGITSTDITSWDTAYGWGNHASAGYLTTETDPVFVASDAYGITSTDITNWDTAYGWGDHSGAGYLTTETDPVFTASDAYGITSTQITNWDTAYGWGDHSGAGYITTELDPVFTASDAYGITSTDISDWDTAYGWGNHASAGYLTAAVESIATGGDNNIVFSSSTGAVTANLAANVTIGQDLTVTGNLTVNGNTTVLNTETLAVEDNVIVLNKNVTGTPSLNAGIEVERGTYGNASLFWNETTNSWYVGQPYDGVGSASDYEIALTDTNASFFELSANNLTMTHSKIHDVSYTAATLDAKLFDTYGSSTYATVDYLIQMVNGSDVHSFKAMVVSTGSNSYVTEYAEIITNASLGTLQVDNTSGTVTVSILPASTGTVIKVVRTSIEA